MPFSSKHLLVIIPLLLIVLILAGVFWQGMVNRKESEFHELRYQVDISTQSVLENVTLLLPLPVIQNSSLLGEALVRGEGYDVPPDWKLSLEYVNESPMLKIFAPNIVPEYHVYPIPIEPGSSPDLTPPPTATGYSTVTPVLMPFEFGISQRVQHPVDTQNPFNREPLLSNPDLIEPIPCGGPSLPGRCYQYTAPIYVQYSFRERSQLTITLSSGGTNQWWDWGWSGNSYDEFIEVIVDDNQQGWIQGRGYLSTGNGRY